MLNIRQKRFVEELLADLSFDPVEAAKRAGYKQPQLAVLRMMKSPGVRREIEKAMHDRSVRCKFNADTVLEYLRIALFFNPLKYFCPDGNGRWVVTDPHIMPEYIGRLVEKMEVRHRQREDGTTDTILNVTFVSKTKVLQLAMKHLGLLMDKVQVQEVQNIDWDKIAEPADEIEAYIEGNGAT